MGAWLTRIQRENTHRHTTDFVGLMFGLQGWAALMVVSCRLELFCVGFLFPPLIFRFLLCIPFPFFSYDHAGLSMLCLFTLSILGGGEPKEKLS